jgi:chromosome segregation ATPase
MRCALSQWVHSQISGEACMDIKDLRQEVNFLHGQRQQLRGAVAAAEAEVRKLKDEVLKLEIKRENAGGEPVIPF